MTTLGERLKKARKRVGMSQAQVHAATGISDKALSRYENNSSYPNPEALQKLSRLYDVSSEYILGLTEDMGSSAASAAAAYAAENMVGMADHKSSASRLISFIEESPSKFHAVSNVCIRLANDGFEELKEGEPWKLSPGGKYYVTRNLSSVIAFKIGEGDVRGFNIISAHCDSPSFRVKPLEELCSAEYTRINTEPYGSMIMSSWLDRPLSVAGRVIAQNGSSKLKTQLVNVDCDCLVIPNVAIHMQRNANSGLSYNPQIDMIPLAGSAAASGMLKKLVAQSAGVKESAILGADLYLYNRMHGCIWGADGEYLSSPRLDDLQCVYGALLGLLAGGNDSSVAMLCVFDNEEVGSGTKQGADSDFLRSAAARISEALGKDLRCMLPHSFAVSADNAHAIHPNHPEYADSKNYPKMNGGIVIKFNGNQRYATDAASEAIFKKICQSVDVPTQVYANRSDIAGGSTLGNISTSQLSLNTVDIGLAQLAMHSSYETAGSKDTLYLERAAAEFYRTAIIRRSDGEYELK